MTNITDIFDTGVDSSGNILGDGVADPHYTLTSFPTSDRFLCQISRENRELKY